MRLPAHPSLPPPHRMSHRRALIAIHIAAVLFGLTGVFGELIQSNAGVITLGRAAFAVLALTLVARAGRRPLIRHITRRHLAMLAGAGLLLAGHWVTFFISVKVGGIAIATLGFASFPAFITLFEALVLRQRVSIAEWIMVLLVTTGLVLITPSFDFGDQGTVGLIWGLVSGFSFAMLAVANRHGTASVDPLQVACWQNLVVALVLLPFAGSALTTATPQDWLWLALLGIFCTGLSHYLFVSSLGALSARSAGLVIALEPVYAIAFAWLLFDQQPTQRMLAGALLIVAAIVWSGLRKSSD